MGPDGMGVGLLNELHAYTDGSVEEATRNAGGGILLNLKDGRKIQQAIPTGRYSTNYKAEVQALKTAATTLVEQRETIQNKVVIFSDALSVMQALSNPQNKELNVLASAVSVLQNTSGTQHTATSWEARNWTGWQRRGKNWIKRRGRSLTKKQKSSCTIQSPKQGTQRPCQFCTAEHHRTDSAPKEPSTLQHPGKRGTGQVGKGWGKTGSRGEGGHLQRSKNHHVSQEEMAETISQLQQ